MSGAVSTHALPGARPLWRLGIALTVSFALHAWFVWGVRVVAPRPAAEFGAIRATLTPPMPPMPVSAAAERTIARRAVRVTAAWSEPSASAEAPGVPAPVPLPPTAVVEDPQPPAPERIEVSSQPVDVPSAVPETSSFGPAVEMPLMEDPEFYPARRLDILPRPLDEIVLRYPQAAGDQDVSGRVVLLILIDELGMVVEASVISSDPPGVFEEAAMESFRNVLFSPAQRHGRAVKSRLPVEVSFDAKVGSMKQ